MKSVDWNIVKRVLVIRLRSIGDTVLATPSLIVLRRFLPDAQIDILLEDWVAPLLDGFDEVDNVFTVGEGSAARLKAAWEIRRRRYDAVFNLHGGTTSTFLTFASGAKHRFGFSSYQYPFLHNHIFSSPADLWGTTTLHSVEQQLALFGLAGVPVDDRPKSRLSVTEAAGRSIDDKLTKSQISNLKSQIALIHPAAAFATKQWGIENFARTAEFLAEKNFQPVAVAAKHESLILEKLKAVSCVPIVTFDDLTMPEITALAARASLFVGNDSGIAHIAAALNTPSVVIFGSSNRSHWRPWTDAPNEMVYEEFPCQPCPGYECKEFGEPRCILSVKTDLVLSAIDKVLERSS
ncbi:MAG: glycosyltransferase family 9 protein [Pyrinomonadaceae bacterium]